ncbi:hypothetical protein [Pseudomonas protegens]|uniref:hypothetical protein n=1 Tax=Pseudomonas protegens TaxID=380021 RepID=UPI0037FD52BC
MFMFRKYSPHFTTKSETSAKRYAEKLVLPGMLLSFLLKFSMPQWIAAILAAGVFLRVCVVGTDYRKHEPDFARQFSLWKRLWVLRRAASFLVGTAITMGVAMGLTQWRGWAHAIHEVCQWWMTLVAMTTALPS